jgi:hypothetical protein
MSQTTSNSTSVMSDIDFAAAWAERWGKWKRWTTRLQGGGRPIYRTPDGRETAHQDFSKRPEGVLIGLQFSPPMPWLPEVLMTVPGCDAYDAVAPWGGACERAWISGCEHPELPCAALVPARDAPVTRQRDAWDNGRIVGRSKSGAAYRAYLAECRAVLKKSGWHEDEIP